VDDTLYRGLADNTVGKIIDTLLRADLMIIDEIGFAPLDDTGTELLFRLVTVAYERRSLAIASHRPFGQWGRSCLSTQPWPASSTGCCITPAWSSPKASRTVCATPNASEVTATELTREGVETFVGHQRGLQPGH
jgi:hypothetical protein